MSWQINLLDSKRSLNVNIFLRQFHQSLSAADIVNHLLMTATASDMDGRDRCADAEMLTCLLKIAPDDDEIQRLTAFSGDRRRLGTAERFILELISLPKYTISHFCFLFVKVDEYATSGDRYRQLKQYNSSNAWLISDLFTCLLFGMLCSYRLRIEASLLKEEFSNTVDWIRPCLDAVIFTARGSTALILFIYIKPLFIQ